MVSKKLDKIQLRDMFHKLASNTQFIEDVETMGFCIQPQMASMFFNGNNENMLIDGNMGLGAYVLISFNNNSSQQYKGFTPVVPELKAPKKALAKMGPKLQAATSLLKPMIDYYAGDREQVLSVFNDLLHRWKVVSVTCLCKEEDKYSITYSSKYVSVATEYSKKDNAFTIISVDNNPLLLDENEQPEKEEEPTKMTNAKVLKPEVNKMLTKDQIDTIKEFTRTEHFMARAKQRFALSSKTLVSQWLGEFLEHATPKKGIIAVGGNTFSLEYNGVSLITSWDAKSFITVYPSYFTPDEMVTELDMVDVKDIQLSERVYDMITEAFDNIEEVLSEDMRKHLVADTKTISKSATDEDNGTSRGLLELDNLFAVRDNYRNDLSAMDQVRGLISPKRLTTQDNADKL